MAKRIITSVFGLIIFFAAFFAEGIYFGIAVAHSIFNIACTTLLLPASALLEKLAIKLVPDTKK